MEREGETQLREDVPVVREIKECSAELKIKIKVFPFSGHEPIYFTENKEKTLRVEYHMIETHIQLST